MNPSARVIRDALPADLPAIVAIYNSTIPSRMVTAELEPVTVESRVAWLQTRDLSRRPIWVMEEADRVVAWLSFDTFNPRAAYDATATIAIYVAEDQRGKGIGRNLLKLSIQRGPEFGIRVLLGYIFSHNEPSLALFRKFEFERWAFLPGVTRLDGVDRDVVIMGKRIAP